MNIALDERKKVLREARLRREQRRQHTIHFQPLPDVAKMLDQAVNRKWGQPDDGRPPYGARSYMLNMVLRRALRQVLRKGRA